jgi:hypothetical protein
MPSKSAIAQSFVMCFLIYFLVIDFLAVTTHVRRSGSVLIAKFLLKEPENLVRASVFASGL